MADSGYRSTLRRRLALFYAALFFASGTAVLIIPLLSIKSVAHVSHVGAPGSVTAVAQHDTDVRSLLFSSVFAGVERVAFGRKVASR